METSIVRSSPGHARDDDDADDDYDDDYVAAKATYIRLLFGKMGVFRP